MSTRESLETGSHDLPVSEALDASMRTGWAAAEPTPPRPVGIAASCASRRGRLSACLPGERLVVPAGRPALRGNGQELPFRAASDYVYLAGDSSPGGVLVLDPDGDDHRPTLFLHPHSDRTTIDFFSDHRFGELWVGWRPPLEQVETALELSCRPLDELGAVLSSALPTRVVRGVDGQVDALVAVDDPYRDAELRAILSELRLRKDDWEIAQVEEAVEATIRGYEDIVRALPAALADGGERLIEGVFTRRARIAGNGPAFNPIVACGAHATILHWTQNDGSLQPDQLLLLDLGVESRTLYAADLTRTLPVGGTCSAVQRRVLDLVNAAHDAGLAAVRPGRPLRDLRRAVAGVMAEGLADWGLLPVAAEQALREDSGLYRRYTLCAPGHMLGLDVHDCAHARARAYLDGTFEPGQVLTVEPGLYFQPDDLTVPPELRGIGARVEDDVVVTASGHRTLSAALPRRPDEIEAWMARLRE